jgi:hypothetical protein
MNVEQRKENRCGSLTPHTVYEARLFAKSHPEDNYHVGIAGGCPLDGAVVGKGVGGQCFRPKPKERP